MAYWEFKGRELVNCTCEYGCNCQFNALPDKGHCHAVAAIQIDQGYHGDTPLGGLKIAALFKWPGPIHEGHGEAAAIGPRVLQEASEFVHSVNRYLISTQSATMPSRHVIFLPSS